MAMHSESRFEYRLGCYHQNLDIRSLVTLENPVDIPVKEIVALNDDYPRRREPAAQQTTGIIHASSLVQINSKNPIPVSSIRDKCPGTNLRMLSVSTDVDYLSPTGGACGVNSGASR